MVIVLVSLKDSWRGSLFSPSSESEHQQSAIFLLTTLASSSSAASLTALVSASACSTSFSFCLASSVFCRSLMSYSASLPAQAVGPV